jgi:hypothetical protein
MISSKILLKLLKQYKFYTDEKILFISSIMPIRTGALCIIIVLRWLKKKTKNIEISCGFLKGGHLLMILRK